MSALESPTRPKRLKQSVSRAEAGRMIGKGVCTIDRLIERGDLRVIRLPGCQARVILEDVERLIDRLNGDVAGA